MSAPDPAFVVSSLPDYVKENQELLSSEIIGGSSLKWMIPQDIKGTGKINYLSVTGAFQNGKGCATDYNTTATITDRSIVTQILERKLKICADTLIGKWPEYLVRIPADKREVIPFEAFLVAELIASVQNELDELIWQGATSTHSGTDLIDGFLTIFRNDSSVIDVDLHSGTPSAWGAIKAGIKAMPAKTKKIARRVFVSPEVFEALCLELVDANLYHFNPDNAEAESLILPGTRVEVCSVPGLADADYLVVTTKDNLYYGTDDAGASKRVKVGYNDEHGYAYMNVRFNMGVNCAFPDRVVLVQLPSAGVVSPDNESALASIAANTAELADADHVFKTDTQ